MKKFWLLTASLLALSYQASALEGTKPNIIMVMTDDQGPHLSYMGHPYLNTVYLDRFASKALRFTDFHVSPTCSPTRAALLSGRQEFKNGVTGTVHERERMALSTTTFPQLLQTAGYQTGIFGKWHLGDAKPYRPSQRGFTEALTHGAGGIGQEYPGSCADFAPNRSKDGAGRYFDNVLLHNEQVVQTRGYCTDVFFEAALGWMKQQYEDDSPFFALITPNTPHAPSIATEESKARFLKRHPDFKQEMKEKFPNQKAEGLVSYYGMIENIDDNFGLMMKKLEEWGALENTLIIFTTDNGATSRHGGTEIFNAGFKTGKGSANEGGGHVPCFWSWKGKLAEDQEVGALTAHIDLYRTFCDLAGVTIPSDIQEIDGRTLIPLLENPTAVWEDRTLYTTVGRRAVGTAPVRDSRWGVRTQRWRLVGNKLYDISVDPYEAKDVSSEYPEVVQRITQSYHQWWEDVLPLLVNEKATWNKPHPFAILYEEALSEGEIPEWKPPQI